MHKSKDTVHGGTQFLLEMICIIVIIECALKMLQLIRFNESFGFLVEMLVQVFNDIYPFLVIFFVFVGFFVVVTDIIESGYDEEKEYKQL